MTASQFALFGPSKNHYVIEGGFCISVFAVIKRGEEQPNSKSIVLLVKPKEHPRWKEEWAPNWRLYDETLLATEYNKWRFPSSYVREGESPENTLFRLMRDQLGIENFEILSNKLVSFYEPSRRYPEKMHWDYCFIYNVKLTKNEIPTLKPWYSSLEFVDLSSADQSAFGSSQGGILEKLSD